MRDKLYLFMTRLMLFIALALFLLLTYYSFRYSQINLDVYQENLTDTKDNRLSNILWFLLTTGIVGYLSNKCKYFGQKFELCLLLFVNFIAIAFSIYLLSCNAFPPNADQYYVCMVAEQFQNGDFTQMYPAGGYIGKCPHQLGLVTFFRFIDILTGSFQYRYFQYWNVLMLPVFITSGYYIVRKIAKAKEVCYAFLLFIFSCLPMYFYIPFVYGEITSTALIMCCFAMMLSTMDHFKWYKSIGVGLTIAMAIQFRKNSLIAFIAIGIVLILTGLLKKNKNAILLLLSIVCFAFLTQYSINKIYEPYEYSDNYGIPSTLYIAMGLNEADAGAGWCNSYHIDTYMYEANADVALSNELALQHIEDRLTYMLKTNGYFEDFMRRKFTSQWNAPMYLSLPMNNHLVENSNGLVNMIYFKDDYHLIDNFSNIHQLMIYVGTLIYILYALISQKCKYIRMEFHTLLICIIGGAIFSLIWEAKARYIFPYYIFMIPYASIGISILYAFAKNASFRAFSFFISVISYKKKNPYH